MEIEAYIISNCGDNRGVFKLERYANVLVWRFSRFKDVDVTRTVIKSNTDIMWAVNNLRFGLPLTLPFEEKDLEWK